MSKRLSLPAVSRHIEIYDEDWEFLEINFPKARGLQGPGPMVREIVHQKVGWLRAKLIERVDQMGPGEGDRNEALVSLADGSEK